jgi:polysaccharide biosynthesis/export protein
MTTRSHGRLLGRVSVILGMSAICFGCQALDGTPGSFGNQTPPAQIGAAAPIASQTFVYWSIQANEGLPNKLMTGQSLISPEGMMELGPYGSVRVAGMNPEQARSAVERHLSRYLKNPKVTLSLDPPTGPRVAKATTDRGLEGSAPTTQSKQEINSLSGKTAVIPAAWERAQMADEPAPPAQSPTIEIPALTPPPSEAKPIRSSEKEADSIPNLELSEANDERSAPAPTPALKGTERVSQWRPMLRPTPTTAVPLMPPGWDSATSSSNRNVISAVAQEKIVPLPLPRQMPKGTKEQAKPEIIQGPPPREVLEHPDGSRGAYAPLVDGGAPVPREGAKVSLPPYVIEPPDILLIESTQKIPDQPVRGQHLVRPDGTVSLGIYGSAYVAGMTIDQAKESIGRTLAARIKDFDLRNLNVDILAYNSKFFYVITDGAGYGQQIIRMPITGNETVLDGISQIYGLPAVSSKKRIWVARRSADGATDQVLPVDWCGIAMRGSTSTNYQIMPGDRIYVDSNKWVRFDTGVARFLSPFERVLGITLLGSETVNSISGRTTGIGGVP